MIFQYKMDVFYDPTIISRRRRIEWPTLDSSLEAICSRVVGSAQGGASNTVAKGAVSSFTRAILDEEISKCDTRNSVRGDEDVFDRMYYITPDYFTMLQNLYWRARRQFTIWDCFEQLVDSDFLSPQCLEYPVWAA